MLADDFYPLEPNCNGIEFDAVRAVNGAIVAEPGAGRPRRSELAEGQPLKVELMNIVEQALDPHGLPRHGKPV